MIIYKVTNRINGKIYIGQTKGSLGKRWRYHCYSSSGCRCLYNAIQKYGADNFKVEQIDVACTADELNQKEQQLKLCLHSSLQRRKPLRFR